MSYTNADMHRELGVLIATVKRLEESNKALDVKVDGLISLRDKGLGFGLALSLGGATIGSAVTAMWSFFGKAGA